MHQKRGQVTIFILLGIIILIGFATFMYVRQESEEFNEEDLVVEPELIPIKEYFENCLKDAGEKTLDSLSLKSGFLNIPPEIINYPRSHMNYDPNGILKLPFWHYDGQYNIPEISEIETELESAIINSTINCLNDLM